MTDRRLLKSNGRVAHVDLRGAVDAEKFVEGETFEVKVPKVDICTTPLGKRDRQLMSGQKFRVLDVKDDWAFGFSEYDGYCGWVVYKSVIATDTPSTHRVWPRESFWRGEPELKYDAHDFSMFMCSEVTVFYEKGEWSCVGTQQYMPSAHLKPISEHEIDTVDVARRFLGTPYVWGGNSGRGIDCSGLIQVAFRACGFTCPGDSDLQESMLVGDELTEGDALEAGDLLFWKGHVAMATGPDTMIHANAHHMSVVEEPMDEALDRIGPTTTRKRPSLR